jgi:O-antigen ligase
MSSISIENTKNMRDMARRVIFGIGVTWGVVTFWVGLAGSFTLSSRDSIRSIIVLIFGVFMILPITIAAIWKPQISAVLLTLSLLLVEYGVFAVYGLHVAVLVALKLELPNILLVCGYAYTACVRTKTRKNR